jgi:hypothetical protein
MTRRNFDRYTADDWREAGPTVGAILANRWLVYTECELRFVTLAKAGARRPETHRPRTRPGLRPVGPRHDLPQDGLPGPGHLLGAAAWGERGCGDDVRGAAWPAPTAAPASVLCCPRSGASPWLRF